MTSGREIIPVEDLVGVPWLFDLFVELNWNGRIDMMRMRLAAGGLLDAASSPAFCPAAGKKIAKEWWTMNGGRGRSFGRQQDGRSSAFGFSGRRQDRRFLDLWNFRVTARPDLQLLVDLSGDGKNRTSTWIFRVTARPENLWIFRMTARRSSISQPHENPASEFILMLFCHQLTKLIRAGGRTAGGASTIDEMGMVTDDDEDDDGGQRK